MTSRNLWVAAAVLLLGGLSSWATADTIAAYSPVSGTAGTDSNAGPQFVTTFSDNGNGTITFDFKNIGSIQSTIANIYFQDGTWITTPMTITDVSGTSWSLGSNPQKPPGATGFVTDLELDSSANNPKPFDGVNNYTGTGTADELKLTFDYMPNIKFSDVQTAVADGGLKVALHVINYADGGSVTFVGGGDTIPYVPPAAPLPSTAAAGLGLLLGAAGIFGIRRRLA